MFGGGVLRLEELRDDYGFAVEGSVEHVVREAGFRSALLLPLYSGGLVIGGLVASSLTPGTYSAAHAATGRQVADLIAPFVQNVVRLQRERRRNRRMRDLDALGPALAASLDVKDVFDRLAEAVRPALDFDVMGICLFSSSGRELERLVEVDSDPRAAPMPWRMDLDSFSFADKIRAAETILVTDAAVELDPKLPGDRLMLDGGARSAIGAPLLRGGLVAGALYFGKRRPYWFDAARRRDRPLRRRRAWCWRCSTSGWPRSSGGWRPSRARRASSRSASNRCAGRSTSATDSTGSSAARRRCARRSRAPPRSRRPRRRCCSPARAAPARRSSPARSTRRAPRPRGRSSPSTARRCRRRCSSPSCSATSAAPSPAPTGASAGRFELAAGGTLFLDEIGEMPPAVQAKLLRVLQEREFQRVGGTVDAAADVAAHRRHQPRPGAGGRATGRFRDDLFYRLDVFTRAPAAAARARRRRAACSPITSSASSARRMGKGEAGLSRDARDALLGHRWPGNIRELQNAVERALIVSDGGLIASAQLGIVAPAPADADRSASSARSPSTLPPAASLAESERRMVADALAKARGNKSRAAKALGLTRSQLYTRMKRFGLD